MSELVAGHNIQLPIAYEIKLDYPDWDDHSYISKDELNKYRKRYIEKILKEESGELNELQKQVIESINKNNFLSEGYQFDEKTEKTFGEEMADKITEFGGSWTFIFFFLGFIIIWILINVLWLINKGFDPYPFILLNLILSCLAALQAPVIMMSQNRQEDKDRQRAEHDYKVNLKAELEIRLLHEKIDHLITHQNKRLLEIQEIQIDFMEEISAKLNNGKAKLPPSEEF